jgi:putative membrane protein
MLMLALVQAGLLALLASGPPDSPATHGRLRQKPLNDPTIVAIFDAANTYDIESSDLAANKAAHPDVRKLGQRFAHDHAAVRQQGRDLAKKLGVKPTPPKDDKSARNHAEAMRKLKAAAKGDDFDQAYLAHEVAYHKAVIDAINQTLLPAIKNPELKAFVQKVGPAFQGHLAAAQKLAEKYGAVAHTSP